MAEVQTNNKQTYKGVKRLSKKSTRVDLTPMVDLGFLLITFFVFTTTLTTPKVMHLNMPMDKTDSLTKVCENCVISFILDRDGEVYYYEGQLDQNAKIQKTSFSRNRLRQTILLKKKKVARLKGKADAMVVIIKSTNTASFQSFVDMMDEIQINGISHYFIDEMTFVEKQMIEK